MKEKKDIYSIVNEIKTKQDFEHFLHLLNEDLKMNKSEWENDTLDRFIKALYASNSNTTLNEIKEPPTWKLFAKLLLTAIVYE